MLCFGWFRGNGSELRFLIEDLSVLGLWCGMVFIAVGRCKEKDWHGWVVLVGWEVGGGVVVEMFWYAGFDGWVSGVGFDGTVAI